jgi:hypothetical protein
MKTMIGSVLQQLAGNALGMGRFSERFIITYSSKTTVDSVTAFISGKWKAKITSAVDPGFLAIR